LHIRQQHEDRDEASALKAVLAPEPIDTTNGVVVGSAFFTFSGPIRGAKIHENETGDAD
jgi:hypothetical protein